MSLEWLPRVPDQVDQPAAAAERQVACVPVVATLATFVGWVQPPDPIFPADPPLQPEPAFVSRFGSSSNVLVARRLARRISRGDQYESTRTAGLIASRVVSRCGETCRIAVTTNLPAGRRYVHWYVNGRYHGMTRSLARVFRVPPGRQINVVTRITRYRSYQGGDHSPEGLSGEIRLEWIRSGDPNIHSYLAQYRPSGGSWTTFRKVRDTGAWSFSAITPQLDDDTSYEFRVVAPNVFEFSYNYVGWKCLSFVGVNP